MGDSINKVSQVDKDQHAQRKDDKMMCHYLAFF
jgi:hypothetical protein